MTAIARHTPEFLSPPQLSERWGGAVAVQTLAQWRAARKGPVYTKLCGKVLYELADVEEYEAKQRRTGTRGG